MIGGPGGSGTDSVRSLAESIWGIFGENYNLIGFDPRGVNNSGPTATCFSDSDSRDSSSIMFAAGINAPLQEVYARTRAATESCSLVNKDSDLGYIGTSAVAQDMRYFIELQATSNGKPADEAKLWYYGVSYGTVIGQTFAALFPDRIERMILDGNVNSEFYYNGLVSSSLTDSDKAIRSFFEYCAEAGPEKCAFAGNDTHGQLLTSEEQLEARFNNLLKKLEEEPLIVVDASFPDIITDYSVRNWVFNQAYGANVRFPYMALALAELDSGNATGFQQIQSLLRGSPATSEVHSSNVEPNPFYAEEEGLLLVTCVDIAGRSPVKTFKDFLPIFYQLSSTSVYYGEGLAKGNGLMCSGFDVPPPESQLFPGKYRCYSILWSA